MTVTGPWAPGWYISGVYFDLPQQPPAAAESVDRNQAQPDRPLRRGRELYAGARLRGGRPAAEQAAPGTGRLRPVRDGAARRWAEPPDRAGLPAMIGTVTERQGVVGGGKYSAVPVTVRIVDFAIPAGHHLIGGVLYRETFDWRELQAMTMPDGSHPTACALVEVPKP